MSQALALLEFGSVAVGMLAVDRMLKKSPVALLRCGTVHPGRYLALVGGSVASTEEAHAEGVTVGQEADCLVGEVCLADPEPSLAKALTGQRNLPTEDTLGVLELGSSPDLLGLLDRVLKALPVGLVEIRLADDLGGRALAVIHGELTDVQEAAALVSAGSVGSTELPKVSVISRLDETLRSAVNEGTSFAACRNLKPADPEAMED